MTGTPAPPRPARTVCRACGARYAIDAEVGLCLTCLDGSVQPRQSTFADYRGAR